MESSINQHINGENYVPSEGETFIDYLTFENTIRDYSNKLGFSVRLDCAKYNTVTREIRWRDIVCSRSGLSNKERKEKNYPVSTVENNNQRNRSSQRYGCSFIISGVFNKENNLYIITKINF